MESDGYIAVASVGSFVEGWSMVVPKSHRLSLKHDYTSQEFLEFAASVRMHIESSYGPTVMFEHGACSVGSVTGCGVDHAHFHIVPFNTSLSKGLISAGMQWDIYQSDKMTSTDNKDYLFYCEHIGEDGVEGLLHFPPEPTSQFFRRFIANKLGKSDVADYKANPHLETGIKTYNNLLSI